MILIGYEMHFNISWKEKISKIILGFDTSNFSQ